MIYFRWVQRYSSYRLDLFGETIESIRTFDADTQRTIYPVNEVRLLPGRSSRWTHAARTAFRKRWREEFEGDPSRTRIYKDIGNGIASAGIEYYLPLFFEQTASVFDYLPESACICLVGDIDDAIKPILDRHAITLHIFESRPGTPGIGACISLFLRDEDFFTLAKPYGRYLIKADPGEQTAISTVSTALPEIAVNRRLDDPLTNLRSFLLQTKQRVLLCAESNGRRETLQQYFKEYDLHPVDVRQPDRLRLPAKHC